jgi:predicted metal-dependent phosphoesterase TrpH
MRCDLHVHTNRKGMCTIPRLNRICRESYNDPLGAYRMPRQRGRFFSINHMFSSLIGRRTLADLTLFKDLFPGVETQNGQILDACNRQAKKLAAGWGQAAVGGSDAHTLAALGQTFAIVPGARGKAEFVAGLKSGWSAPVGRLAERPLMRTTLPREVA